MIEVNTEQVNSEKFIQAQESSELNKTLNTKQNRKHWSLKSLFRPGEKRAAGTKQNKTVNKSKPNTKPSGVNNSGKAQVEFDSLVSLETGLQWVENLVHILTPRLLVLGFVLSMVDLLTNGSLLKFPAMIYIWAIVQALAVDATLPNMWRLAFIRFDERRWITGIILLLIGICLGLVVFAALAIQFLQQSESLSLNQAMSKLWVNPEILTYVRSGSVVFLAAVLSVLNRTKVNSKHRTEQNKTVNTEPVNTEKFTPAQESTEPVNIEQNKTVNTETHQALHRTSLHVVSSVNSVGSKQEQIQTILEQDSDARVSDIAKVVGVSKGYASQQKAKFSETK